MIIVKAYKNILLDFKGNLAENNALTAQLMLINRLLFDTSRLKKESVLSAQMKESTFLAGGGNQDYLTWPLSIDIPHKLTLSGNYGKAIGLSPDPVQEFQALAQACERRKVVRF